MKIVVTKAYHVSSDATHCIQGGTGGENELCVHYKNPKVKGGIKNHRRMHVCTLFNTELKTSRWYMTEQPEKCAGCLSAART